jgi:hypothetical protein
MIRGLNGSSLFPYVLLLSPESFVSLVPRTMGRKTIFGYLEIILYICI